MMTTTLRPLLRRFVPRVLVAFLLGAGVSVGLAVVCAYSNEVEVTSTGLIDGGGDGEDRLEHDGSLSGPVWQMTRAERFGQERCRLRRAGLPVMYQNPVGEVEPPFWCDLPQGPGALLLYDVEFIGTGWPVVCLRTDNVFDLATVPNRAHTWRKGYLVRPGTFIEPFSAIVVPLSPVWSGLAINTLFWGGGFLAVYAAFVGGRSVVRRARGRCGKCGYDLRGQPQSPHPDPPSRASLAREGVFRCPECGALQKS